MVFQCSSGVIRFRLFINYSFTVFGGLGINASYISIMISGINLLLTCSLAFIVERFGRRTLMITGITVMVIGCAGLIVFYALNISWAIIAFAGFYLVGYGLAVTLISRTIVIDAFPSEALPAALIYTNALRWVIGIVMSFSMPLLISFLTPSYVFIPFLGCLVAYLLYTCLCIPETKGLPGGYF